MKGYELKLHVDELVNPVPFGFPRKVDAKLDGLLELNIIEEVLERAIRIDFAIGGCSQKRR